ncbi:MAG: flagellar hook-associated protein FlgK [Devosia sp. 67-54]|uniref:flagellar hook-associated protein FlgK n=1 Tax=unclassified Devosia TaxID=196773 RepID=UPI0009632230|nr:MULTISPECIES: flagellar hook-associated protein FlgK [unclassified Devosia]MBN9303982.1 flagellar hook-associated protein FlgK [Devosia sp.]OJX17826.1 MAG: flagellar hook-associated protein FlgK [Devosia sp. 67-54]
MGLGISLANALTGMATSQASLNVVSRNVANAGTPGYHKQSLSVIDTMGVNSIFARTGGVQRAFDASLQANYNSATSNSGYTSTMSAVLDQLQTYFGKPGEDASLDTMFGSFMNALQALGTSPDDFATRATVVSKAQSLVSTLNSLSSNIQSLRQSTETQMQASVTVLNQSLQSLAQINQHLASQSGDEAARSALMDQRDRLVSQISEQIDVQATYRNDGTVALMTRTGVGLLDVKAATFEFDPAGTLTAEKLGSTDPAKSAVGSLKLISSSGLTLDLVQQNVLQSGNLKALTDLRDKSLVSAQSQLDQVAASLAQAMNTVTTQGTPAGSAGAPSGYSLDLSALQDGNDFTVDVGKNGVTQTYRFVRVDDPSKRPLDYYDANGAHVVGVDFSGGMAQVAQSVRGALGGGFAVTATANGVQVLDDGSTGTTDVNGMTSHATVTSLQGGANALALNLFVDNGDAPYTDSLGGRGQKLGFAARITINSAILADNRYLVQYQAGGSMGDDDRANYLLDQLSNMRFATPQSNVSDLGAFRLSGSVGDLISQTMDYTGNVAADAKSSADTQQTAVQALNQRLDSEYGVNVDEEMARLLELQNAYSANARVISAVQDLMSKLLDL